MSYLQHHFNVDIAKKFGVNVAIFLDQMVFWITKNRANHSHYYDGSYWTRNTAEAYTTIFPYWSIKQMRKVISDCEKYGLINIGNFNKIKYDQTRWYSLTEYAAKLLNIPILPNGKMDLLEKEDLSSQKDEPIPVTNTVTNTERAERKKRVPLPEDFQANAEAKAMAQAKGLDLFRVLAKFRSHAKSEGRLCVDWDEAFMKWVIDEKVDQKIYTGSNIRSITEPVRPKMRDFTQERLDRENNGVRNG